MTILDFDECSICFEKIAPYSNVYYPKFSVGLVCESCNNCFDEEGKEILTHVFNVGKGSFGAENDDLPRIKDVLYDVQSELKQRKEHFTPESVFLAILKRSRIYCLNLSLFALSNIKDQQITSEQSSCIICNNHLGYELKDHNLSQELEFICNNCIQRYSNEEIQVMAGLFRRYGGSFGQLKDDKVETRQIATDLIERLKKIKDSSRIFEINELALHRALLHGFTPQDFIEELKKI